MATAMATASKPMTGEEKKVIFASSLGTVFEWYDFYLYGSLAGIIAKQFFSGLDPNSAFIFALLAFAAGFIVRPFGALVFGRLGDMIGRKYTFLVTILIMGLSTFVVGVLPTYASIGVAAPVILIGLRLLQGLALGGEYGGAATYVAEHAPQDKRGAFTSWIQTTATLGPVPVADGDPRHAHRGGRGSLRRLGLAHSVPGVDLPAGHQRVDPPVDERVARLQEDEGRGQDLEGAAERIVRPVEEPEDRHPRARRPDRRPGRRVVHGPVLCAVLPDADAEDRRRHREHPGRAVAA